VAIAQNVPLILRGDVPVLSKSPIAAPDVDEELLARLQDLYSKDDWLSARLSEAIQSEHLGAAESEAQAIPTLAGPRAPVDRSPPPRAWRRHHEERRRPRSGGARGHRLGYSRQSGRRDGCARSTLARALTQAARARDRSRSLWGQTAVLVMTEFGRTAAMNGTRGTDHGTGGCAFRSAAPFVADASSSDWPGLGAASLLDKPRSQADVGPTQRVQRRAR